MAAWDLEELRTAGFNRISFGMQSAVDHVLRTLDRTHDPMRVPAAVEWARRAGFEHVNLDLIYGTPGESDDDWRASLDAAIGAGPDHVSAYALIVEEGTQLARRIRRGEVPMTDDDEHADRYLIADERFAAAGLGWYEVSNWATSPGRSCRHNELYWTGGALVGRRSGRALRRRRGAVVEREAPGGVRRPARGGGVSPGLGREVLGCDDRRVERILLEPSRLVDGCPSPRILAPAGADVAERRSRTASAFGSPC